MAEIDTTNWLRRRSAGLVFEASIAPLDPELDALVILYDNEAPEYISGNARTREYTEDRVPFSRHFFNGYPKEMVKKIRIGGANNYNNEGVFGTLALATKITFYRNDYNSHVFGQYNQASATLGLDAPLAVNGLISDSNIWTGGENKLHVSATSYQNILSGETDDDPPKPIYRNLIINYSYDYATGGITDSLVMDDYSTQRVGTTYLPFAGNGSTWYGQEFEEQEFFVQFSGELVEYTDATPITQASDFYYRKLRPRLDDQESLGVSEYLPTFSTTVIGDDQFWQFDNTGGYPPYTFKGLPSWVATAYTVKINVDCKFVFQAPNTCTDCWYEGATVELKIKYKQATLSRVFVAGGSEDAGGFYTTVGSLSDHSEVTKNITLPGKGATPTTWQDVGDEFEMPQEEGKLIVIDDFEVVSITLPGDTPPA